VQARDPLDRHADLDGLFVQFGKKEWRVHRSNAPYWLVG
jgi:hypothetical protein